MDGMDLLQGVQEVDAEAGMSNLPPNFKLPSMEQMMDLLSKMDISDEEKVKLMEGLTNKADVLATLGGQGAERIKQAMGADADVMDLYAGGSFYILFIALSVLAVVFGFFGYKLYKSLMDKERKRDEKRKLKQMKKKK